MDVSLLLNCPPAPPSPTMSASTLSICTLLNPREDIPLPVKKRPRLEGEFSTAETSPISISISDYAYFKKSQPRDIASFSAAKRLAQSRVVGLRHRKNEKERIKSLEYDLDRLRDENAMLLHRIQEANRSSKTAAYPYDVNININIDGDASEIPMHKYSNISNILGCKSISGEAALLLLELIALRRNLAVERQLDDLNATLECPQALDIERAIHTRIRIRKRRNLPNSNVNVIEMHARWAHYEANSMMTEEKEIAHRRCSRCAKLRAAGSGHPRSSCDDGLGVGSMIPYSETRKIIKK